MTEGGDAGRRGQAGRGAPPTREARLKAALKANMARRKAQGRARAVEGGQDAVSGREGDHRPDPDRQEDGNG